MKVAIVTPVFNDWDAFVDLLHAIDVEAAALDGSVDVIAVDDGSTVGGELQQALASLQHIREVSILELACNLGHQRAIAIGLAHAHRLNLHDVVVVMDSDGEDRPEEIAAFVAAHHTAADAIIVGQRKQRSEGAVFRLCYGIYKWIFGSLTGRAIDFGNFCLVPRPHVARLVHMPELWNHLAATILRSRVPVKRLRTCRGKRYAGYSSMNFVSLVVHGLSAIAVFNDVLFVRLLVASLGLVAFAAVCAAVAIALRVLTDLATPGWATTVVGMALVIVAQGLTLSTTAAFMTLSNRASLLFVPAVDGLAFIKSIRRMGGNVERLHLSRH